jgi:DNA replication protein DnaC
MVSNARCPLCQDTGWQQVEQAGVSGVARCECTKRSRMDRILEEARIPQRYADCELNNFEFVPGLTTRSVDQAKLASERFVEEYPLSPPIGLMFVGRPGVGKTHLAVGIIKRLMREKAVACLFRTFPELLKEIQLSYNKVSNISEFSLMSPVLDAEVLVLDELGGQKPSAWVLDTVGFVLNHRYNDDKTTILTTNFPDHAESGNAKKGVGDALVDRVGDRMRSRLYEMCKTIDMKGDDFRLRMKQKAYAYESPDKDSDQSS